MNEFRAKVLKIDNMDNLNIVEFNFENTILSMMSLDLYNLKVSSNVILTVKSTNIGIAKNLEGEISLSNLIKSKIVEIEIGKLLTSITLKYNDTFFTSIITTKSAKKMNLQKDNIVDAIFKSSDLSIKKILND